MDRVAPPPGVPEDEPTFSSSHFLAAGKYLELGKFLVMKSSSSSVSLWFWQRTICPDPMLELRGFKPF